MTKIKLFKTLAIMLALGYATLTQAQWTKKDSVPLFNTGTWGGMAFAVNGKAYFGGGYVGNNTNLNEMYEYDPATGIWAAKNDLPGSVANRSGGITFTIDGKAYLGLGIVDFNSFTTPTWTFLTDLWQYNPSSDTWTKKADFPGAGRGYCGVFVVNNKAYVVGGNTGKLTADAINDVYEYDPASDKWTKKADYPNGNYIKNQPFAFGLNNKGYIVGGQTSNGITNANYQYDPATDTWTAKKAIPLPKASGGVSFIANGKGYCTLGSQGNGQYNPTTYAYHPDIDDWEYVSGGEFIGAPRMFGRAVVINNKAYIGAGWRIDGSNQTWYKDWYEFDPQGVLSVPNTNRIKNTSVYPNPATDIVHIQGADDNAAYTIYNKLGQQVLKGTISNSHSINTSTLVTGQYFIIIQNRSNVEQHAVTVQ